MNRAEYEEMEARTIERNLEYLDAGRGVYRSESGIYR